MVGQTGSLAGFLPTLRRIPRPKFDVPIPNAPHQADLLFMTHDKIGRKVFKYVLTVVDVASRFKESEPLTSENFDEGARAFEKIFKRDPFKWPKLLQVDPGHEFMGAVSKVMENHGTTIRCGHPEIHRDQAIAEQLFGQQYAVEKTLPASVEVRHLFQPGELEGGVQRATDL